MPGILSIILTIGVFFWGYFLMMNDIPEQNKSIFFTFLGSYMTAWMMSIGYYFGTTFASGAKDSMIYNSTPAKKEDEK
jgi:hypothetical protein